MPWDSMITVLVPGAVIVDGGLTVTSSTPPNRLTSVLLQVKLEGGGGGLTKSFGK